MSHVDDGTLNALLDGELSEAEALKVQDHVGSCSECGQRLEEARAFLAGAGELLNVLVPPALAAPVPPRRVSKTHQEPALDIDGSTQKSPAIRLFPHGAERAGEGGGVRVARTAPEPAVVVPDEPATAPTARSPAVEPGALAAIRGRPVFTIERLAWAASIVLALGVGYLVNEVRVARLQVAALSARVDVATLTAGSTPAVVASDAPSTEGSGAPASLGARAGASGSPPPRSGQARAAATPPGAQPATGTATRPADRARTETAPAEGLAGAGRAGRTAQPAAGAPGATPARGRTAAAPAARQIAPPPPRPRMRPPRAACSERVTRRGRRPSRRPRSGASASTKRSGASQVPSASLTAWSLWGWRSASAPSSPAPTPRAT